MQSPYTPTPIYREPSPSLRSARAPTHLQPSSYGARPYNPSPLAQTMSPQAVPQSTGPAHSSSLAHSTSHYNLASLQRPAAPTAASGMRSLPNSMSLNNMYQPGAEQTPPSPYRSSFRRPLSTPKDREPVKVESQVGSPLGFNKPQVGPVRRKSSAGHAASRFGGPLFVPKNSPTPARNAPQKAQPSTSNRDEELPPFVTLDELGDNAFTPTKERVARSGMARSQSTSVLASSTHTSSFAKPYAAVPHTISEESETQTYRVRVSGFPPELSAQYKKQFSFGEGVDIDADQGANYFYVTYRDLASARKALSFDGQSDSGYLLAVTLIDGELAGSKANSHRFQPYASSEPKKPNVPRATVVRGESVYASAHKPQSTPGRGLLGSLTHAISMGNISLLTSPKSENEKTQLPGLFSDQARTQYAQESQKEAKPFFEHWTDRIFGWSQ